MMAVDEDERQRPTREHLELHSIRLNDEQLQLAADDDHGGGEIGEMKGEHYEMADDGSEVLGDLDGEGKGKLTERDYKLFHLLIFGVYATNVLGQDAVIPCVPLIQEDLGFSSATIALVASFQDMGMVSGKLIHGWLIDALGPRRLMFYTFMALSMFLFALSFASNFGLFALLMACISFVGSATDPAEVCIIGNWCAGNAKQLSKGIWVLGLSSRLSGLLAIVLFAGMLRVMTWRWALRLAFFFPLIGCALTHFIVKDTSSDRTRPGRPLSLTALLSAAKLLFKERLFWGAACVHSAAATIRRMDVILGTVYHDITGISPEDAAALVVAFPLGVILGLLLLGTAFRRLKRGPKQRLLITGMWGLVVIGCLGLMAVAAHRSKANNNNPDDTAAGFAGLFVFLIGVGVSVPYYMAAYSYAAAHGGKSIGLSAALIEAFAFCVAALVYLILGGIISISGWSIAFFVLAGVALTGGILTWVFMTALERHGGVAGSDEEVVVVDNHHGEEEEEEEDMHYDGKDGHAAAASSAIVASADRNDSVIEEEEEEEEGGVGEARGGGGGGGGRSYHAKRTERELKNPKHCRLIAHDDDDNEEDDSSESEHMAAAAGGGYSVAVPTIPIDDVVSNKQQQANINGGMRRYYGQRRLGEGTEIV